MARLLQQGSDELDEGGGSMSAEFQPSPQGPPLFERFTRSTSVESDELISPVLYDLILWGSAEQNSLGERVLRSDVQVRLDRDQEFHRRLNAREGVRCTWGTAARPVGRPP